MMVVAGKEEKQLAEKRGDFHEGVPITVVVDGGWNKCSHATPTMLTQGYRHNRWSGNLKAFVHWSVKRILHSLYPGNSFGAAHML